MVRIQLKGAIEIFERLFEPAQIHQDHPSCKVHVRSRFKFDSSTDRRESLLKPPKLLKHSRQIEVRSSFIRIQSNRTLVGMGGFLMAA